MADEKISQMTDGGFIQTTDQVPVARSGDNYSVTFGSAAAKDFGTSVGDLLELQDDGAGNPALPPIDGSQLTGLVIDAASVTFDDTGLPITSSDVQDCIEQILSNMDAPIGQIPFSTGGFGFSYESDLHYDPTNNILSIGSGGSASPDPTRQGFQAINNLYTAFNFGNNAGSGARLFYKSRSASIGGHTIVQDNDQISAEYNFASNGTSYTLSCYTIFAVDGTPVPGTPGPASIPSKYQIYVTSQGATGASLALEVRQDRRTILYGGLAAPITTAAGTSGAVTLDGTHFTILVNASGAGRTVNLPDATTCAGRLYNIKKIDSTANAVTVDPFGSQTIDSSATRTITTQWTNLQIQSDGANWMTL